MVQANALWPNRHAAGQALAQRLSGWREQSDALVLGLPRGGVVVVAAEVARALQLPLASWAVRKLAHPRAPELALGAIAPGGVLIWDEPTASSYGLDPSLRQRIVAAESHELERRRRSTATRHRRVCGTARCWSLTTASPQASRCGPRWNPCARCSPACWCWPCR